jgi:hypothetical protein
MNGLPLLDRAVITRWSGCWDDSGLWDDVRTLANRFWAARNDDEARLRWHHLVLAVGNFKRQDGRRLKPPPVPPLPDVHTDRSAVFTPPGSDHDVDREDASSWEALHSALHGAGVATTTALLAALWPDHHVIYDRRVHAAANGLRLAAQLATTPGISASGTDLGRFDMATYQTVRGWITATADVHHRSPTEVERSLYCLDQEIGYADQRTWNEYVKELHTLVSGRGTTGTAARSVTTYMEFWDRYLRRASERHPEWRGLGKPTTKNYLYQTCSIPGCHMAPGFKGDARLSHELVIMSRDADANVEAFTALRERRDAVERIYGRPLTWDERPGVKRYLIGEYRTGAIDAPDADVDEYIDWFVDCGERLRRTVDRFRHVVAPYLDGRG